MESTNAVIRILNSGSPKPPKNPTTRMSNVATVTMAGITQMFAPIEDANTPAAMAVHAISANIAKAIGCLHTSFI